MHDHATTHIESKWKELPKVVLVGNPNVGKSVIFQHLTGRYVTVSNYPGTTVDISSGVGEWEGRRHLVLDTPGMSSLQPTSQDEEIARKILTDERPNVVIQVSDSKNMVRTLFLTLQLSELGLPLILNLNMADEAAQRNIEIDTKRLEELLGIPIVSTVATEGVGIASLKRAVSQALRRNIPLAEHPGSALTERQLRQRLREASRLEKLVTKRATQQDSRRDVFGNLAMHPLWGWPILAGVLWLMYKIVGELAAIHGVDLFEKRIFGGWINPLARQIVAATIPISLVRDFLVGPFGLITMALTYAIAIILPIVSMFFIFFSVLEDTGYLPRLALLLHRAFKIMGLHGKAVLPMILGIGCDTMATITTRILDTPRERIIATLLLALAIPCSAQLGVVLGMLAGLGARGIAIWLAMIIGVMLVVGYLASKILPGRSSDFIIEIPPTRVPRLKNILVKTLARIEWYLKEAVPLFFIGTAVLFALDRMGVLTLLEKAFAPIVVGFLGLPQEASASFIMGFLRRDYGAAGFFHMSQAGLLSAHQTLVALVTITLFVPCLAQFLVMFKERGTRVALGVVVFVFPFAIIVGGVLHALLLAFPGIIG